PGPASVLPLGLSRQPKAFLFRMKGPGARHTVAALLQAARIFITLLIFPQARLLGQPATVAAGFGPGHLGLRQVVAGSGRFRIEKGGFRGFEKALELSLRQLAIADGKGPGQAHSMPGLIVMTEFLRRRRTHPEVAGRKDDKREIVRADLLD